MLNLTSSIRLLAHAKNELYLLKGLRLDGTHKILIETRIETKVNKLHIKFKKFRSIKAQLEIKVTSDSVQSIYIYAFPKQRTCHKRDMNRRDQLQ